jgi:hypothetical protein
MSDIPDFPCIDKVFQTARARQRAHTLAPVHVITHLHCISHSVNSIAQTAAWQLQHTDIRVNALCPGLIETGMTAPVFNHARKRGTTDRVGQLNPMGRYGVAEGVSRFSILFT